VNFTHRVIVEIGHRKATLRIVSKQSIWCTGLLFIWQQKYTRSFMCYIFWWNSKAGQEKQK